MDCNVIPSPLSPFVSVEVNCDDSFAVNSLFVQRVIFDGKQHFRAKHSTIELTLIEHISEYMPVVIEIVAFDPMLREEAGRLYLDNAVVEQQLAHLLSGPKLQVEIERRQRDGLEIDPDALSKQIMKEFKIEFVLTRINLIAGYHKNCEKLKNLLNKKEDNAWAISFIPHFHDPRTDSGELEVLCEKPAGLVPAVIKRHVECKDKHWGLLKKLLKVAPAVRRVDKSQHHHQADVVSIAPTVHYAKPRRNSIKDILTAARKSVSERVSASSSEVEKDSVENAVHVRRHQSPSSDFPSTPSCRLVPLIREDSTNTSYSNSECGSPSHVAESSDDHHAAGRTLPAPLVHQPSLNSLAAGTVFPLQRQHSSKMDVTTESPDVTPRIRAYARTNGIFYSKLNVGQQKQKSFRQLPTENAAIAGEGGLAPVDAIVESEPRRYFDTSALKGMRSSPTPLFGGENNIITAENVDLINTLVTKLVQRAIVDKAS